MSEPVSLGHDVAPGDFGMRLLKDSDIPREASPTISTCRSTADQRRRFDS
jgi:hypothetical protein